MNIWHPRDKAYIKVTAKKGSVVILGKIQTKAQTQRVPQRVYIGVSIGVDSQRLGKQGCGLRVREAFYRKGPA